MDYKRYALWLLGAFVAAWMSLTAVSVGAYYLYPHYIGRAANVRIIPTYFRLAMVLDFAERRLDGRRDAIFIVGDSQLYGWSQNWRQTFSVFLEEITGRPVVNASVVDGRFNDVLLMLAAMKGDDRIRSIVYNVDPWHFWGSEGPDFKRLGEKRAWLPLFLVSPSLAFSFLTSLETPSGPQSFQFVRQQSQQPKDVRQSPLHVQKYRRVLNALQSAGGDSIVLISPQEMGALSYYNYDIERMRADNAFLLTTCREYQVTCIDLSERFARGQFQDIIHLNTKGHRALAGQLAEALRR